LTESPTSPTTRFLLALSFIGFCIMAAAFDALGGAS